MLGISGTMIVRDSWGTGSLAECCTIYASINLSKCIYQVNWRHVVARQPIPIQSFLLLIARCFSWGTVVVSHNMLTEPFPGHKIYVAVGGGTLLLD